MSTNNRPLYRAYTVAERGEGKNKRKSYCEIGAVWEVTGGLRAALDGNLLDGVVYLIDPDEEYENIDTVSTPELGDTPLLYPAFTVVVRGEGKKKRERWRLLGGHGRSRAASKSLSERIRSMASSNCENPKRLKTKTTAAATTLRSRASTTEDNETGHRPLSQPRPRGCFHRRCSAWATLLLT